MGGDELARWVPASIGAVVSVILALRIYIRYDRLFVDDARRELLELRVRVTAAEAETEQCRREREEDRREIELLKRQVAALTKETP